MGAHCRTFPILIYALGGRNNPPQPLCLSHLSYTDPGKYKRGLSCLLLVHQGYIWEASKAP
jgi:hypothetical protein